MSNHNSTVFPHPTDNFNHVSFSFDNLRTDQHEPRKTIDQYLRLKTNQSIQEKTNLPNKRSLCYRKSMKGSQADPDSDYQMQLRNDEQSLRIESLTKQYQLKLAKQEEFFSLREWKLKQEIENLNHQVGSLNEEVRRLRVAGKQQNTHCSLCSDGQVITHLNAVLKEAEESHRHCLDEKKEMTKKMDNSNGRVEIMEEEQQRLYQQCKTLNKQVRACHTQIHQLEQDSMQLKQANSGLKETIRRKEVQWHSHRVQLQQSIEDLRKKMTLMERKEEESIANSKVTTQSFLATAENNMNGSFINHKHPQKMQQRASVPKMPLQEVEDRSNIENYQYFRKMSGSSNKFSEQRGPSKMESLKWKFF